MSISTASWQARNLAEATTPTNTPGWELIAAVTPPNPFVIPIGAAIPMDWAWENNTGAAASTVQISYGSDNSALTFGPSSLEDVNGGNAVPDANTGFSSNTMMVAAGTPPGSAVVTAIFTGLEFGTSNLLRTTQMLNVTWA